MPKKFFMLFTRRRHKTYWGLQEVFLFVNFIFKPSSCDMEEAVPPIRLCVQSVGIGGSWKCLELSLMMWNTK